MAAQQDSWISDQLRQKARQQLEETFTKYTNPFPKSAEDIENTIYGNAKQSKENYVVMLKQIMLKARAVATQPGTMRPPMPATQQVPMAQGSQMQPGVQSMRQYAPMPRGLPPDSPQNISMQSPLSSAGVTGYSPDSRMPHPSPGSQFYSHIPPRVSRAPPPQPQPPLRMPDSSYPTGSVGSSFIPNLSPAHPNNSPQVSAMSPALRTPGSISVAHSPASAVTPSPSTSQDSSSLARSDEQLYMEKLKQLQKYIEPLSRMINKTQSSSHERNSKDLSKMKSLRDVLMDSSKRLAMGTLLKCEKVLQNWADLKPPPTSSPSRPDQHMCQPILDAIASDITSPMINHTLKRTFGPALQVLNGDYYIREGSCTKKRRISRSSEKDNPESGIRVPDVIQGEIARLGSKFRVTIDQSLSSNCGTLHLICRLDDPSLPSVPPIRLLVPSAYPKEGPEWKPWDSEENNNDLAISWDLLLNSETEEPNVTTFLSKLRPNMEAHINHAMDNNETISAVLTAWDRSVKDTMAAC